VHSHQAAAPRYDRRVAAWPAVVSDLLARQAGSALFWRAIQLVAGKVIYLARYLILARLLAPDDFGLFAIAIILLEVLQSITDFGMIPALVQRRDPDERHYDVAWTVAFTRGLAISGFLLIAAPLLASLFAEPRATNVLRALALRPLLSAVASIRVADLERRLEFRPLALIDVPAALAGAVVSIALAQTIGVWALVAGTLAGAATGVVMSYVAAPYRPRLAFDRDAAGHLFRFGRWVFISGLLGVIGQAALRAIISRRLGTAEVGVYFLAASLAALPNDTISNLVGAVAFPVHARIRADARRASEAFRASLVAIATVLLPTYAALIVLAPSLAQHVLGPQWAGTAPIIQLLALAGVLGILFAATAPMLEGRGNPQKVTALLAILSGSVVVVAWGLAGRFGLVGAALAWVLAQVAVLMACVAFARQILARPFGGLSKPLLAIASASAASAVAALALDRLWPGFVGVVVGATLAAAAAGILLWALDRWLDVGLVRDFARAFPTVADRLRLSS
jgi:lipopolysaccharide exporter